MKQVFAIIFSSFLFINGYAQKLANKTYIAEMGATCKDMTDGGCMIYTYRILEFKKDSVTVSYRVKANCTSKDRENGYEQMYDNLKKTYRWKSYKNILTLENFSEISNFTVDKSKIIGRDNERMRTILFTEVAGQKTN